MLSLKFYSIELHGSRFVRRRGMAIALSLTFAPVAAFPRAADAAERPAEIVSSADAPAGRNDVRTDDSMPDLAGPDGVLSLEKLVAGVLASNPTIESARSALRAAAERPAQERALEDPMFSYMTGPGTYGSGEFDVGQKFELSQAFPWPGKRRLRGQAAEHGAEAMRGDLETVREHLAYEARVAYFELWLADRSLEINRANRDLLEEFKEIAEDKYGAGLVSKQDALQATVEFEMLVHDGDVLKRERNRIEARINALLDRPTDGPLPAPADLVPSPAPPPGPEVLTQAALRKRPELVGSEAQIHANEARAALARKEFYPDFRVMAAYDTFWQESELRPSIGFSINLPVQLARRRAAVEEANASISGAQAKVRRVRRDIQLEVDEAYERVHEALEGIALYEGRLLPAAEENLNAARSGYASGEVDFLALISAQKLLMDTTLRASEANAAYHVSLAELLLATGESVSGELRVEE